jgi:hypothetical protein
MEGSLLLPSFPPLLLNIHTYSAKEKKNLKIGNMPTQSFLREEEGVGRF